jgi:peptidoglycan lytic transglycosylase
VAALVAVLVTLPATVAASDGGTSSNSGGGATYTKSATADAEISLRVASGAWLGRATRIRGRSADLAGRTVAIERRRSRRSEWVPVGSVRVGDDGRFATSWTPRSTGRHQLRALPATASSAGSGDDGTASRVKRLTVYQSVTSTWYGPGFYGNKTACGQRLSTTTLGVAHRSLPCGTQVALRANGRSIVVPVIDRGPYADGVTYDLTRATAERLGVMHTARIGAAILSR